MVAALTRSGMGGVAALLARLADDERREREAGEAHERYVEKYGREPAECVVNPADACTSEFVPVRVMQFVAPNHFYIGDDLDAAR